LDREVIEEVSSADAVAQFVEAVDRLGAEVQRLQQRAEKLDAQQQITATLDRFDRW
jgi:ubiquinone biosynthesis protein UbiJ